MPFMTYWSVRPHHPNPVAQQNVCLAAFLSTMVELKRLLERAGDETVFDIQHNPN